MKTVLDMVAVGVILLIVLPAIVVGILDHTSGWALLGVILSLLWTAKRLSEEWRKRRVDQREHNEARERYDKNQLDLLGKN